MNRQLSRTSLAAVASVWLSVGSMGQVKVDRSLVLEGATDADRQVSGLPTATTHAQALNASTMQAGAYRFASVNGANLWNVTLSPQPDSLVTGTMVILHCQDGNNGPVQAVVNGQGPYAVLRDVTAPLDSGEVKAGAIITLVFDGSAFQMTSARTPFKKECPSGFAQVDEHFCVQMQRQDSTSVDVAAVYCSGLQARLCTWSEWYTACTKANVLGITDMVGEYEWTDDLSDAGARVVGKFSCYTGANSAPFAPPGRAFRCCYRR